MIDVKTREKIFFHLRKVVEKYQPIEGAGILLEGSLEGCQQVGLITKKQLEELKRMLPSHELRQEMENVLSREINSQP